MTGNRQDVGWDASRSAAGAHNPWLITFILSMATFMQVLDTSIANVALLHIAGSLGASVDESTWVITSYLVANAIILPISGWLSEVIGRKRFYMLSVALFAMSSLLCGIAPSLGLLVAARALQGLGGGGMAPSEQAMLADTFPPSKRAQAFAAYGVAVIVAPALGPTIGGYITDNASWHWIFFINVPVGALSLALVAAFVDEPPILVDARLALWRRGLRVDWLGFVLVALWLGFLEIVLDKGQEDDWFNSGFIVSCAIVSGLAFLVFVPWELSRKEPIVDIRLIGRRQFGVVLSRDAGGRRDPVQFDAVHAAVAAGEFRLHGDLGRAFPDAWRLHIARLHGRGGSSQPLRPAALSDGGRFDCDRDRNAPLHRPIARTPISIGSPGRERSRWPRSRSSF